MKIEELLEHLDYNKCNCEIDYRPELGIFNGVCPNHSDSLLMVDGKPIKIFLQELNSKTKKLAHKATGIV